MWMQIVILSKVRERQVSSDIIYMWNLIKMMQKNLLKKNRNKLPNFKAHLMVAVRETVGGGKNWEGENHTYTALYKRDD